MKNMSNLKTLISRACNIIKITNSKILIFKPNRAKNQLIPLGHLWDIKNKIKVNLKIT